jgi:glutamate-1-semialdehyde 2,1-aminomutase
MGGLIFSETPPKNYREWATSDYTLYDALAQRLLDRGILCEPDSREPWFVSAAHDDECLAKTLEAFEGGLDETLRALRRGKKGAAATPPPPPPPTG